MRCRTLIVSLAVCFTLVLPVAFAQEFSSVEERMSSADFKAAGLDKLSPEELTRLNAFIKNEVGRGSERTRAVVEQETDRANAGRMGFKDFEGEREEIVSTIVGDFKGWSGSTTFTLANGQVWRTSDPDSEFVVRLTNPVVHISPGFMGNWNLHIEGYGTTTKVERIK